MPRHRVHRPAGQAVCGGQVGDQSRTAVAGIHAGALAEDQGQLRKIGGDPVAGVHRLAVAGGEHHRDGDASHAGSRYHRGADMFDRDRSTLSVPDDPAPQPHSAIGVHRTIPPGHHVTISGCTGRLRYLNGSWAPRRAGDVGQGPGRTRPAPRGGLSPPSLRPGRRGVRLGNAVVRAVPKRNLTGVRCGQPRRMDVRSSSSQQRPVPFSAVAAPARAQSLPAHHASRVGSWAGGTECLPPCRRP